MPNPPLGRTQNVALEIGALATSALVDSTVNTRAIAPGALTLSGLTAPPGRNSRPARAGDGLADTAVGLRAAVRPPRSLARLHRWRVPDSLRSAHGRLASVVSAAPVSEFFAMLGGCLRHSFGAAFARVHTARPNMAFERTRRYGASCLVTSVAARRST
jgi:hypothetical protein